MGDDRNDISMFWMTGLSIAMEKC
ncbi:HAD hydrolase family protein [Ornithinibacillus californiensis]